MTDASRILVLELEYAVLTRECDLLRAENNTLRPQVADLRHALAMAKKVKHEDQEQRPDGCHTVPGAHQ
jgi:hypothetical protein